MTLGSVAPLLRQLTFSPSWILIFDILKGIPKKSPHSFLSLPAPASAEKLVMLPHFDFLHKTPSHQSELSCWDTLSSRLALHGQWHTRR